MGDDGHSALHWAALKGNLRAMLSLLRAGAHIDAQDNWRFTPIIRAAQNGHLLAVLLLLQVPFLCGAEGAARHGGSRPEISVSCRRILSRYRWMDGYRGCSRQADSRRAHAVSRKSERRKAPPRAALPRGTGAASDWARGDWGGGGG